MTDRLIAFNCSLSVALQLDNTLCFCGAFPLGPPGVRSERDWRSLVAKQLGVIDNVTQVFLAGVAVDADLGLSFGPFDSEFWGSRSDDALFCAQIESNCFSRFNTCRSREVSFCVPLSPGWM